MYFSGFKNLIILSQGRSVHHLNDTFREFLVFCWKAIRLQMRNGICWKSNNVITCKNSATAFGDKLQSRSSPWGSRQYYLMSYLAWLTAESLLYSLMLCSTLPACGKCEGSGQKSMCVLKPFPFSICITVSLPFFGCVQVKSVSFARRTQIYSYESAKLRLGDMY